MLLSTRRVYTDGNTLPLFLHLHIAQVREIIEVGPPLYWNRAGEIRKIPKAVLQDVVRLFESYFPNHYDPNSKIAREVPEGIKNGVIHWEQTI